MTHREPDVADRRRRPPARPAAGFAAGVRPRGRRPRRDGRARRRRSARTGGCSSPCSTTSGRDELTRRWEQARRLIRENGITHNVYGDPNGLDRPWSLDPSRC